jgi:hypothetical protein
LEPMVLHDIPFQIDFDALKAKLRLRDGSPLVADLERLVDEALRIGRPKALYGVAYIDSKGDDSVVVDGVTFSSHILRVNLDPVHRVFPFVTTCGMELQDWGAQISDMLQGFWAETIKEFALLSARAALDAHLEARFLPGHTSVMNPGSLEDWPITQQRPLFTVLGDTEALVGVRLTDSMLMVPTKTVSGIRFPTEINFVSCKLCPREECPNRRAPRDEELAQTYEH